MRTIEITNVYNPKFRHLCFRPDIVRANRFPIDSIHLPAVSDQGSVETYLSHEKVLVSAAAPAVRCRCHDVFNNGGASVADSLSAYIVAGFSPGYCRSGDRSGDMSHGLPDYGLFLYDVTYKRNRQRQY